jgi:hypothetical protein
MRLVVALALSLVAALGMAEFSAVRVLAQTTRCDMGPVSKAYGSTQWLVYSCDDHKTVVMVSAPGSPAMPFYFTLYPKNGQYQLEGEGTGSRSATKAAAKDLAGLSAADIVALIEETEPVHRGQGR